MSIKVGDVVQLKSGGPKMTVRLSSGSSVPKVCCNWFDGLALRDGTFIKEQLNVLKTESDGD